MYDQTALACTIMFCPSQSQHFTLCCSVPAAVLTHHCECVTCRLYMPAPAIVHTSYDPFHRCRSPQLDPKCVGRCPRLLCATTELVFAVRQHHTAPCISKTYLMGCMVPWSFQADLQVACTCMYIYVPLRTCMYMYGPRPSTQVCQACMVCASAGTSGIEVRQGRRSSVLPHIASIAISGEQPLPV